MPNRVAESRAAILEPQASFSPSNGVQPQVGGPGVASASVESGSLPARIWRHPLALAIIFGLAALPLLLFGIEKPAWMFYDEGYFVAGAKVFIQGAQAPAQEKPPLGKLILSLGIRAAGDNPLGWRIAAAVCGALALVAIFLWTYLLLHDTRLASLAAGLTAFNNFWFVMSRIGMMDAFLMLFLTWSLVAFTASLVLKVSIRVRRLLFCAAGVLVGLAGACKWNAIDTLAVFFLVTFVLLVFAYWPIPGVSSAISGYASNVRQIGAPAVLLALMVAPIASYSLSYWPLCRAIHVPFSVRELLAIHKSIWHFNTTTISTPSIITPWYKWPFNLNPQRGLSYLVGNPVVAWGGLAAMMVCLRRFCKAVTFQEGMVFLLFAANYLQWAVTPEKGVFYYYYYPSVVILGVTIAVALRSLPDRVFGVSIRLLLLLAAGTYFLRCYPQMMHLEAPWDCAFGCWP